MKIISYNVNGIRAAMTKGFVSWLQEENPDIVCIQELKAEVEQVDLSEIFALGYEVYWHSAQKKGYSGVAIFSKIRPNNVSVGCGIDKYDAEGRVLRADYDGFSVMSVYMPSGSSGDERQAFKMEWLNEMLPYLNKTKQQFDGIILCGDYNIAHREIDIHDPKGNKKSSGFLPEERAWMDQFIETGWIDSFRQLHPEFTGGYTWWSQRFPTVRLQNKGWRIDYICVTDTLSDALKSASIFPDVKHSDHCPIFVELSLKKPK